MSVQISYTKQFVFGVILIIILLFVVEITSRVILEEKDSCTQSLHVSGIYPTLNKEQIKKLCSDYQSIIEYVAPYKFWGPNQHTQTVNINSDGFRGQEIIKSNNDGKYRIMILGGSTAYGVYASSDSTTISGYLQSFFTKNGYDVEVINAGVNGANSLDETFIVKNKIIDYEPDMIIAYDGWNDLWSPIKPDIQKISLYDILSNKFTFVSSYTKIDELHFFLNRVITKNIYGDRGSPSESVNHQDSPIKASLWEKRWSEICLQRQENDFLVVIILQPLLGSGNKTLTSWEDTNKHSLEHQSIIPSYSLMKSSLQNMHQICDLTIDLTNVFDERNETIFIDNGHVGDLGNSIIAEKIYEKILPAVLQGHDE
jgi:lysophospholipase L1-like esterase